MGESTAVTTRRPNRMKQDIRVLNLPEEEFKAFLIREFERSIREDEELREIFQSNLTN